MLIQSYEMAPLEEVMPYFRYRLRPLVPQVIFGRSAALFPNCKSNRACFDWYRDAGIVSSLLSASPP